MELHILAGLRGRIEWHDTLGSTNDRARELAIQGVPNGFVVGTDAQTAGRGRKGSTWLSEPGNGLAMSIVVRPSWPLERWGWISLTAGLAVAETLTEWGLAPKIKWPNDVLIEGRKICGILIETVGTAAVIGIGINVNEREFPPDLNATSLGLETGEICSRESVLGEVWTRLLERLEGEPEVVAERAWELLAWRGEEVVMASGQQGRIRGFGENGELTIETEDKLVRIAEADGVRLRG